MMKPKQKELFRNKYGSWAVITGASSGIGRELSIRVAETGIDVVIIGRNRASLEDLKFKIQKTYSVDVEIIVADLSEDGVNKVIEFTANKKVGLLIASAGFGTSGNFLLNSDRKSVV